MNRLSTANRVQIVSALVEGVSRSNLSKRMGNASLKALNKCIQQKIENHGHAVALCFLHYNFYRVHKTLRVTPAMEAGIANHVWSLEELVSLLDVKEFEQAA